MTYGALLRSIRNGNLYFVVFALYVAFCLVGLLNVVTGIFVDSAVCTRTQDEVVDSFLEDQKEVSEAVRRIFREADSSESGILTYEVLLKHMETPWVKAYFSGLNIDPSEAQIIFTLM